MLSAAIITQFNIYRIMYVLEWRTVSALMRVSFWCLFPELRSNEGNKHQNNTHVGAKTVCHEGTNIILFLTRHDESMNDGKMTIFTHRPHVSLAQFPFCWWRHKQLLKTSQWPDSWDAITWIAISNYRSYSQQYSRPVVWEDMILNTMMWLLI